MGKLIIGFIYYIVIGFISVIYKIAGINPFARKKDAKTYWLDRSQKDTPDYQFTLKEKIES